MAPTELETKDQVQSNKWKPIKVTFHSQSRDIMEVASSTRPVRAAVWHDLLQFDGHQTQEEMKC